VFILEFMRALLQRVSQARVTVDGSLVGEIGAGLLILLGVAKADTPAKAEFLVDKILNLRIWQIERRHPGVWTTFSNYRSEQTTLLVIEHDLRANQIRTVIIAASVGAMAACALDHELFLTALHRIGGRNWPADQLGSC